jgi:hypothetical protein
MSLNLNIDELLVGAPDTKAVRDVARAVEGALSTIAAYTGLSTDRPRELARRLDLITRLTTLEPIETLGIVVDGECVCEIAHHIVTERTLVFWRGAFERRFS